MAGECLADPEGLSVNVHFEGDQARLDVGGSKLKGLFFLSTFISLPCSGGRINRRS
jgi:hypothetical protein